MLYKKYKMNEVDSFYGAIKERSDENKKALEWLLEKQIYSLVGSIIRMELDSLFRLCYFKSRSESEQALLLKQFIAGHRWSGENGLVTDRKMVKHLADKLMLTWAVPIYDIGCAFIHLSPYHDWNSGNDPTRNIWQNYSCIAYRYFFWMCKMDFNNKIIKLIETKREDDYWDFKESWHTNKANLLHDIICLANNRTEEDGLLIFGIKDNSYEITGSENDPNRKNQQNIIDFLKDKNFVGNIRPSIEIKTIYYMNHEIDVLIIKNSNDTPFYLNGKYSDKDKTVRAFHIYTRVKDTNTSLDSNADINYIEYLWKKRFNLTVSPIKRIFEELKKKENWKRTSSDRTGITVFYNTNIPEFTVEFLEEDDDLNKEFYAYIMVNNSTSYYNAVVKYFNTEVFECQCVYLDGGRYVTTTPNWGFIDLNRSSSDNYAYKYFIKGSKEEILQQFFFNSDAQEEIYAKQRFDECVLYFNNEDEQKALTNIITESASKVRKEIDDEIVKINLTAENDVETKYMKRHIAIGRVIKKWQNENYSDLCKDEYLY